MPAGDVFRARPILALADGMTYAAIKKTLHTTAPTISRWKQRFEDFGIGGLDARHKGIKPRTATPAVQAKVCRKVQQKPDDGSTHWSVRKLASELGVSKSSVHRILGQARLQPHRLDGYMASNDPNFEPKAVDIIGLYLEPPQHAAVFCVDEKTAIQALDGLDTVLPLSLGRAERHGFEHYQHGTLSLLRGTRREDRERTRARRRNANQRRFHRRPKKFVASARWAKEIHIVLGNLSAHKTKAVEQFPAEHLKVRFHFTATYSPWLNQVEL